jgi:hypothetical protein
VARSLVVLMCAAVIGMGALAVRWDDPGVLLTADPQPVAAASASEAPVVSSSTTAPSTLASTSSTTGASLPRSAAVRTGRSSGATATTTAVGAVADIRPGVLHRPAPGTYAIRVVEGGTTTDGTLTVDAEQWQRRVVGGDRRVELLVWALPGATLASSGEPGTDGACDWDHQVLEVPTDLAEGRAWSSQTACSSTISGRAVRIERLETAEVRTRARTQLGGSPIDTWVIDRRVVVSIQGTGISTITDATSTELFAPDLGLSVFQASTTKVPQPDGSVQTVEASEELLQRTPSPT